MNVAIHFFGTIPVYAFSLLVGIGSAVGLLWTSWRVASLPKIANLWSDAGLVAMAGALLGGRAGFVLVNWPFFYEHPGQMPQIWLGGLAWWGALAGGIATLPLSARRHRVPAGDLADNLLPLLTSTVISVWMACWVTGAAYGVETGAWWGVPARDEWGTVELRWPTQLTGGLAALGIHWLVEELRVRGWSKIPGVAASLQVGATSLTILTLLPTRADPAPGWNGFRLDFWMSLGFFILSVITLLALWGRESTIRTARGSTNEPINQ